MNRSRAEQIARCEREIEACIQAASNPNLSRAERLGALQGEVDWMVAKQMAEEDDNPAPKSS